MATFSDRLKELRKEKKLTQQEIANRVGVNRVTYTNWENGKREPELDKVVELATELDSTLDYLMGKEEVNILHLTSDELTKSNPDKREWAQEMLVENLASIFEIGKQKFDLSDSDMELLKEKIIKEFFEK